jgi:rhodanese-related sulfurtransferase
MKISVDLIRPDPANMRSIQPTEAEEAGFRESLRLVGLLQPILVRPTGPADARGLVHYQIMAGERRYTAAVALGWTEIECTVMEEDEDRAAAIQAAENFQRQAVHPIDRWRAMVKLQEAGNSLEFCAQLLGITDKRARQLDKLGRVHFELLNLMEKHGLPNDRDLIVICQAPHDVQLAALKANKPDKRGMQWWNVARACEDRRISIAEAIFDTKKSDVQFTEDLFAEPGEKDTAFTTDLKGFMAAQSEALQRKVAAWQKKGKRVEIVQAESNGHPKIPAAFAVTYEHVKADFVPPADDHRKLFITIGPDGRVRQQIAAEKGKKAKKTPVKAAVTAGDADGEDDADEADDAAPAAPPAERAGITKKGQSIIAVAKTAAVRKRLADDAAHMQITTLLDMLVLAIAGNNVEVHGDPAVRHRRTVLAPIARKLLNEEGKYQVGRDSRAIAAEMIAAIVVCNGGDIEHGSGMVAEIIGHALSASEKLDRFDSEEFLSTCSVATLKEAAESELKVTNVKGAAALRARLVDKAPRWAPEAADYRPGPIPVSFTETHEERLARIRAEGENWDDEEDEEDADAGELAETAL